LHIVDVDWAKLVGDRLEHGVDVVKPGHIGAAQDDIGGRCSGDLAAQPTSAVPCTPDAGKLSIRAVSLTLRPPRRGAVLPVACQTTRQLSHEADNCRLPALEIRAVLAPRDVRASRRTSTPWQSVGDEDFRPSLTALRHWRTLRRAVAGS
jgi:hypothetical protein